jgi:hypothetical protein
MPINHEVIMKTKIAFQFVFLATITLWMNGCCTASLVQNSGRRTADTFSPSAVYRTTNHNTFALEGTRHNDTTVFKVSPSVHSYLIIPKTSLASANLPTNEPLSLAEIRTFPAAFTLHLKTTKKLSANYEKIANLPNNDVNFEIKEHHPGRVKFVLLPFSVAADAATLPLQIIFFPYIAMAFSHNC